MVSNKSMFDEAFLVNDGFFTRLISNFKARVAPSTGTGDVPEDSPLHLDMLREEIVFKRLGEQLGFAFGELQRDPAGFIKVLVSPDESNPDQLKTRQAAWALTVVVPLGVIGAFLFGILVYFLIYG